MLRTVVIAAAAAAALLGAGYRVICVAPPIEQALQEQTPAWWPENAPPWWLTPMRVQPTESGAVLLAEEPHVVIPMRLTPSENDAETTRVQLQQRYRMPILEAPVDMDRQMVIVPDESVEYPMPVIVPEVGIQPPADKTPPVPSVGPVGRIVIETRRP